MSELIYVGTDMQIRWDLVSQAVPAFVTVVLMPLTYSIAYGARPVHLIGDNLLLADHFVFALGPFHCHISTHT